jgi:hypothetical protein
MNIIYYYLLLSLRNIGFVVIGNDLHQVRCKHRLVRYTRFLSPHLRSTLMAKKYNAGV